jgi:CheY-like chemotaxis protein
MASAVPRSRPWILVADDDASVRSVWVEALRQAGYRPIEATTGREALELMRTVVRSLSCLTSGCPTSAASRS